MYGCNKLYCEHLGRYYARHYKQLAADNLAGRVDFRCVRFPGLISAMTTPSGGTSDYAPEMIHAAASGERARSFALSWATHHVANRDLLAGLRIAGKNGGDGWESNPPRTLSALKRF